MDDHGLSNKVHHEYLLEEETKVMQYILAVYVSGGAIPRLPPAR